MTDDERKLLVARAKVGIIALVDEATGYQNERPKDELLNIFAKEMQKPKEKPHG